jgi:alpha-N-arabinofuranosidase
MRPEYYADLYRHYISFVRKFGDNKLYRIACGPYGDDLHWTETMMKQAGGKFQGMGMHYYCHSGRKKQLAVEGTEDDWYFLLHNANRMDELLKAQVAVLDHHDPSGRTTLLVDEWGTWHEVEPDTNPGFLYQQNTIRDALATSVTLDIFNRHCRRVYGANIAQTVNVLQAMILTEGDRMLLTPTYHVFEMYVPHHDATCLPCHVETEMLGEGDTEVPRVSASASRAEDGSVHVTMTNLDADAAVDVSVALHGVNVSSVKGRVLAGDALNSHNTIDQPNKVAPEEFDDVTLTQVGIDIKMPPRSVMSLAVQ